MFDYRVYISITKADDGLKKYYLNLNIIKNLELFIENY